MTSNSAQDLIKRVHEMAALEFVRNSPIETLNLHHSTTKALHRAGIITIGDMIQMIDNDPLAIQRRTKNFGLVSYARSLDALYKVIPSRETLTALCFELADALQEAIEQHD